MAWATGHGDPRESFGGRSTFRRAPVLCGRSRVPSLLRNPPIAVLLGWITAEKRTSRNLLFELKIAEGCHKGLDLAGRRGIAGFQVALNAQSGEVGQHHFRNCRRSHLGFFGFDIHCEKAFH